MRESIIRRYGGQVARSVELLRQHPESAQCRAAVARELRDAGADRDPQLVALAERLRALVEAPGRAVLAEDPVERVGDDPADAGRAHHPGARGPRPAQSLPVGASCVGRTPNGDIGGVVD
ncbi:Uncharacterised protein [Amycolatopsis camponoti]|uniref:Uncharacterized protein n=1 Tax=Amycolatopsis camponoti TaxID=2606593 RepID=A0A6I8LS58_9PSEU|nr:hypothetical protein [Amycolatopsis camponoti]VVJ18737.1 Uncharacterised protein [Amycolatopsis camponoti]